ncbi:MAG: VOC family protein [Janthinobacterium lividum]
MTLPIPLIDHVIVNARDRLDDSAALWSRLGFQLTPRGHHTLGSSNNLAILGNDYIELLGVQNGAGRTDVLDWPAGLNGLVFKTLDSDALHEALRGADVPVLPPQAFSRPVDMGDGRTGEAAFRTVRLEAAAVPAGRMFFCHHLTPELVWHDPWRRHPNGAIGLAAMLIAAQDPAALGHLFTRMFGADAIAEVEGGITLQTGLASVEVLSPAAVTARLGTAGPALDGRAQVMAALHVRTQSLARAGAVLQKAGIITEPAPGPQADHLMVPASQAGGVALIFQE